MSEAALICRSFTARDKFHQSLGIEPVSTSSPREGRFVMSYRNSTASEGGGGKEREYTKEEDGRRKDRKELSGTVRGQSLR